MLKHFEMGRIMAIDYGSKRVGIAVTDPQQIISTGLTTVHSKDVIDFLKKYFAAEKVDCIVIGEPKRMNNQPSEVERLIGPFIQQLKKTFPDVTLKRMDERFTSKIAFQTMLEGGLKKKDRQNKETVDMISATIILQSYMEMMNNK